MTERWYDGDPVGDGYAQGWFDRTKAIVADAIGRGTLTEEQAVRLLIDRFRDQWSHREEYYVRLPDA